MVKTHVFLLIGLLLYSVPQIAEAGLESGLSAFEHGDYGTAYRELRPLAEDGDPKAQYYIGLMSYSGRGVAPDSAEAIRWMKPAAEKGIAEAQYLYALLLEGGPPGSGGKTEAIKWFTLASDQGNVDAQMKLVDRYLRGEGVRQDLVQAYTWCGVAQLHVPSRCNPREYLPTYQMTLEQQEEAKRRVQQWVTKHPVNASQPSGKSAQQLIAELDRADSRRSGEIKAGLIRMGDSALPAIAETFRGPRSRHIELLKDVLCERGPEASIAIPEFIRLFNDPSVSQPLKPHVLSSLTCIGKTSPAVESLLIALLKEGSDDIRPWAAMLLEKFDSREVALALSDALNDSRRSVREKAAENLWSMGPKAAPAVPALAKQMDRKGTYLATVARSALKAIGTPEAIAEIKKRQTE